MLGVDDPSLLESGIRDDMDDLEASLNVNHPDLDWSEAIQPFKDEADAAIGALTNGSKSPRRED